MNLHIRQRLKQPSREGCRHPAASHSLHPNHTMNGASNHSSPEDSSSKRKRSGMERTNFRYYCVASANALPQRTARSLSNAQNAIAIFQSPVMSARDGRSSAMDRPRVSDAATCRWNASMRPIVAATASRTRMTTSRYWARSRRYSSLLIRCSRI